MEKVVGVLGGGQLGRMLTEVANRLNIRVLVLDAANSPAKQINADLAHITGSFANADDVRKLASQVDVLTIEIEHVNTQVLQEIRAEGAKVDIQPSAETISLIQDKYAQKLHLINKNIDVADSFPVDRGSEPRAAVQTAVDQLGGYPVMLKARKDAYDGRGNFALKNASQIQEALDTLGDRALYAERWASFKMELAVMVVKTYEEAGLDYEKSTLAYPTVETIHEDSICKLVYAPARKVSSEISVQAQELARKAIAQFEGKGIFGVEMFLLENDKLLINEIAPRPHNSGHYTIEACPVSQYEAHLRAILDIPICAEDIEADRPAIMLNLLGTSDRLSHKKIAGEAQKIPRASVHLYGKGDGRPKRKMGHVTVTAKTMELAEANITPLISLVDDYKAGTQGQLYISREKKEGILPENDEETLLPFGGSRQPVVLVTMGSDSDLDVLRPGIKMLEKHNIPHQVTITSAHRTPDRLFKVAAEAKSKGFKVVIAAAGGAAHLPGMFASKTPLPVIGVPVKGKGDGMDAMLSIVQMPPGCPVASVGLNNSINAALLAIEILALSDQGTAAQLDKHNTEQRDTVHAKAEKLEEVGVAAYSWP